MYQPERFQIDIPEPVPTYAYVGPCRSSVTYYYPSYYPCEVVVRDDNRNNALLSETCAIRRELSHIKSDINEIKYRQTPPTYYTIQENDQYFQCAVCNTLFSSPGQSVKYSRVPLYYCEQCRSFVEKPATVVSARVRSKTPITTYQDSYRPPTAIPFGHLDRRITLNELQTQPPLASAPAQHPRPWIPTGKKNDYPHRRWNLSVPHCEP